MLHLWLIPALLVLLLVVFFFYLSIRRQGGTGVRTEGHTLVDHADEEPPED